MKLNIILLALLCVRNSSSADPPNEVQEIETACEDFTKSAEQLKDVLSSSACELDFSGEIDPQLFDVDDFYEKYYKFCEKLCECPFDRKLGENIFTKTLVPVGECDAVVGAFREASDKLSPESKCEIKASAGLEDYFCEGADGNPNWSVCQGYYNYCFRRALVEDSDRHLDEITNLTNEDIHAENTRLGGNADGVYSKKHNGLPADVCDELIRVLEEDEDSITIGYKNRNRYLKLTGEELVNTIGKDNAKELLDFFHDALGYKSPVTQIKIQKAESRDEPSFFTGHKDGHNTMIVFLNQNYDNEEFQGGGIYHYVGEGMQMTDKINQGMTIVHGKDVVHNTLGWTGTRYILDIASHPERKWADCMISDLVN